MSAVLTGSDSLRRVFAAITEHTFQVELGVADPPMTDYIADLLVRFTRVDAIFRVRDSIGRRLEEVAEMLLEAQACKARPQREIHRHIGDFTLFWAGLYPEALSKLRSPDRKDHLIDYSQQGKESYFIASTFDQEPYVDQAPLMRQLSDEFEMLKAGLRRVRFELDRLPEETSRLQSEQAG